MKIWVDMSNSPHVVFFKAMIREWEASGHEVIITARPLSNTIPLLESSGLPFTTVGAHYGKNLFAKLLGFPRRCAQLYGFLKHKGIDVAITQSSFYSPVVAKMIGARSIYTNDNEYARGNILAFLLSDLILLPACLRPWISRKRLFSLVGLSKRVSYYPGIKEGIYLHTEELRHGNKTRSAPKVFFRPEPWEAQYHTQDNSAFDNFLKELGNASDLVIVPRSVEQANHYRSLGFSPEQVLDKPLPLMEIARTCDLFVGAGGTMSRELAILGVPTLSLYRGKPLAVDSELTARGLLSKTSTPSVADILATARVRENAESRDAIERLKSEGKIAYSILLNSIAA